MDREAERLGIPDTHRRLVPKTHTGQIAAKLNQIVQSDAVASEKAKMVNGLKDAWGTNWPRVYSDLGDKLSGPLKVATSGISPDVASTVLSLHDKSFDELTKVIPKTDKMTITDALQQEFEPYVRSTGMNASSLPNVATFFEQAKKLTAVYVQQGQSPDDAAAKAFNDVLGFKYRFETSSTLNVRIPKVNDFENVEVTLDHARRKIIESGKIAMGMVPNFPGAEKFAEERTRNWLDRNAKWVTLPDDSGVGLFVQGKLWSYRGSRPWAGEDAQPVVLTWDEIQGRKDEARTMSSFDVQQREMTGG